jgi:hypothetical protein
LRLLVFRIQVVPARYQPNICASIGTLLFDATFRVRVYVRTITLVGRVLNLCRRLEVLNQCWTWAEALRRSKLPQNEVARLKLVLKE